MNMKFILSILLIISVTIVNAQVNSTSKTNTEEQNQKIIEQNKKIIEFDVYNHTDSPYNRWQPFISVGVGFGL